jgi:hypothetical protein
MRKRQLKRLVFSTRMTARLPNIAVLKNFELQISSRRVIMRIRPHYVALISLSLLFAAAMISTGVRGSAAPPEKNSFVQGSELKLARAAESAVAGNEFNEAALLPNSPPVPGTGSYAVHSAIIMNNPTIIANDYDSDAK